MLSGMRKAQQGWLGKIIVTVMFGFLILSFGIWGIGDIFRITHREVVASTGSRDITTLAYRDRLPERAAAPVEPIAAQRHDGRGLGGGA